MKIICIILLITLIHNFAIGQETKLMTYNIRYATENDGNNKWENRKESVIELINFYEPSIFGIQEGKQYQVNYIDEKLSSYSYIGVGRDDGEFGGEYSSIYFDTTIYRVSMASTFWLSETGNVGSIGWDAAYPRICTFGLFEHIETNKNIWVLNTHFDHIGEVARHKSAQLILQKIKTLNVENYPVALMGDFNLTPDSKPIQSIKEQMKDAYDVSQKQHYGPTGTFNGFDPNNKLDTRIDYIFIQNIEVNSIIHIDDKRDDGFFISDHLPVLCKLQL